MNLITYLGLGHWNKCIGINYVEVENGLNSNEEK